MDFRGNNSNSTSTETRSTRNGSWTSTVGGLLQKIVFDGLLETRCSIASTAATELRDPAGPALKGFDRYLGNIRATYVNQVVWGATTRRRHLRPPLHRVLRWWPRPGQQLGLHGRQRHHDHPAQEAGRRLGRPFNGSRALLRGPVRHGLLVSPPLLVVARAGRRQPRRTTSSRLPAKGNSPGQRTKRAPRMMRGALTPLARDRANTSRLVIPAPGADVEVGPIHLDDQFVILAVGCVSPLRRGCERAEKTVGEPEVGSGSLSLYRFSRPGPATLAPSFPCRAISAVGASRRSPV